MHVRIAWVIYDRQKPQADASKMPAGAGAGQGGAASASSSTAGKPGEMLRAPPIGLPSHLYPGQGPGQAPRPHEMAGVGVPAAYRPPFDPAASHSSYLASAAAASHLGGFCTKHEVFLSFFSPSTQFLHKNIGVIYLIDVMLWFLQDPHRLVGFPHHSLRQLLHLLHLSDSLKVLEKWRPLVL